MIKVLFIGLGHLGEYFSEVAPKDWHLSGTYRSMPDLKKFSNFQTFHFDSEKSSSFPFSTDFDCVVWSFPPFDAYPDVLVKAHKHFKTDVPWIYVGSTGVYGSGVITEKSSLSRETPRQQRLAVIEETLKGLDRKISIVRPCGLIDERRNPKSWVKSGSEIKSSENKVNFVYTKDVARFIIYLIHKDNFESDFNLSASVHPKKSDLYAKFLSKDSSSSLTLDGKSNQQKIIINTKSKSIGFSYLVDSDLLEVFRNNW